MLREAIRAAIAKGLFQNIPGLRSITDNFDPVSPDAFTPAPSPARDTSTPTLNPTPMPDATVSGIRGPVTQSGDSALSAGGYVGVAVASLVVLMICVFAGRHRRGAGSAEAAALKHRQFIDDEHHQFTDDESDEAAVAAKRNGDINLTEDISFADSGVSGAFPDDEIEVSPRRLVHVVDEQNSLISSWEIPTSGKEQLLDESEIVPEGQSPSEVHGSKGHSCSSPNCVLCEQKRQSGVRFIETQLPQPETVPQDAERSYVASDTVEL